MGDVTKHIRRKKILGNFPFVIVFTSMTLALFVLGIFCFILVHANQLSTFLQESIEVHVVLNKEISESQRAYIETELNAQPFILRKDQNSMIKYVSENEARKDFIKTYGEDFMKVLDENPLHSSFILKIKPEYLHKKSLADISLKISKWDQVKEVYYLEDLADQITKNIRLLTIVFISFSIILLVITILLINNTIKLALYSQRFLIRSMQLVGATKFFIQKPFLARAFSQGLISGITASLLLAGAYYYVLNLFPDFQTLHTPYLPHVILSLILFGGLLGLVSSLLAVNKYLKMSLDELY
ncbi:MAG TPA: permease-like cell division protein FtsX [Cytophagaceae bacterium]|jgi:cell division transport system permease protein|nr:permease-like cell division protein FtsX [Cytophagaceae bacterium]